jgi:hypothetical protein
MFFIKYLTPHTAYRKPHTSFVITTHSTFRHQQDFYKGTSM